ncbi:hypothetical protein LWI29_009510 [Acer saccharum]|uniref:Uncharacterized protein n=1 Tax=Acer saccharum TaxID=4024 RepID=A0AA39VRE8_ACESA|nr:hypothetical protein LWI29_009510 [Acer saccharum]
MSSGARASARARAKTAEIDVSPPEIEIGEIKKEEEEENLIHYFYTWLRFDFELHKAAKKFWDQMVSQEEDQDNYSHLGQVCMDLEDDDEQENIEAQMGLEDDDQLEGPEDGDDVEYQEDDEEYMEDQKWV